MRRALPEPPLILTKILPPRMRPDLLHRPQLIENIQRNIERKLVLVCAPAGYGKTSLLIDFADATEFPVCWYSLEASDRDPVVFVDYLVASLRRRFHRFGRRTLRLLHGATDFSRELRSVIGSLVNEIYEEIPDYFVLMLDDYHLVDQSPLVNASLSLLLQHLPENCHIILSSRAVPGDLPLLHLTAKREMSGLGKDELRFSAGEIKEILARNYGQFVTNVEAEQIALRSEGWITAILLSRHLGWERLLGSVVRAQGTGDAVFAYFAQEVYARQDDDIQAFLAASSVLDKMSPTLCDRLLGRDDSQQMLERLEQRSLFLTRLEGDGEWSSYHHLFHDFLLTTLRGQDPAGYLRLQLAAARLYESEGSWAEAIKHYVEAECPEEAARIIEHAALEVVGAGRYQTVATWLEMVPLSIRLKRPRLLLTDARIQFAWGQIPKAASLAEQAEQGYRETQDRKGLAEALEFKGVICVVQGRFDQAIDFNLRALELLEEGDVSARAQAHLNLGLCHGTRGDYNKATFELTMALRLFDACGDHSSRAKVNDALGIVCAKTGNAPAALRHYERALAYWRRSG
ncbi:MAG: tetratricopeptide repeat protein, partial [Chloroflexota bacterium]